MLDRLYCSPSPLLGLLLGLLISDLHHLLLESFLQFKQVVDLLDCGQACLSVDDLADAENLDSSGRRQLDCSDLLIAEAVFDLVLSLFPLTVLGGQLVASVDNEAHLSGDPRFPLVLLGNGVNVEVQAQKLGERLLAQDALCLEIALLDSLGGQDIRAMTEKSNKS